MTALTTPYDQIVATILDRMVAIEATIPDTVGGSNIDAGPRFWESVAVFPHFFNRLIGIQFGAETSLAMFDDQLTFKILLVTGSLASGYMFQQEDMANKLVYSTVNRFRRAPHLNDPLDGSPLRYLAPGQPAKLTVSPSGVQTIKFDQNGPDFMSVDFILQVNLRVQLGRVS